VFECETGALKKSRSEVICFLRLVGKYNFAHATEQCMKLGAKLPEITSSLLQRVVQTKKVIFKHTNKHMCMYEIGYYSLLCVFQMSNLSQFYKHLFTIGAIQIIRDTLRGLWQSIWSKGSAVSTLETKNQKFQIFNPS